MTTERSESTDLQSAVGPSAGERTSIPNSEGCRIAPSTSIPSATSRLIIALPIKPFAPVTSTRAVIASPYATEVLTICLTLHYTMIDFERALIHPLERKLALVDHSPFKAHPVT